MGDLLMLWILLDVVVLLTVVTTYYSVRGLYRLVKRFFAFLNPYRGNPTL